METDSTFIIDDSNDIQEIIKDIACNNGEWTFINEKIGHGDFSTVYIMCKENNCEYIGKVIDTSKNFLSFIQEVNIMETINQFNTNLAPIVYDSWTCPDGQGVIVMEKMDQTVYDIYRKKGIKGLRPFLYILFNIIEQINSIGIIHHDPKLDNFFYKENNQIKLGDYGLATLYQNNTLLDNPNFRSQKTFDPNYDKTFLIVHLLKYGFQLNELLKAAKIDENTYTKTFMKYGHRWPI